MDIRRYKHLRTIYNLHQKYYGQIKKIEFVFRSLLSRVRYRKAIFLDTNMLIAKEAEIDKRIEKFNKFSGHYFITDAILKEVNDLSRGLKQIFPYKINNVSFADLRQKFPSTCPVYYNFIFNMYNPANIASPDFPLHLLQSIKLRNRKLDKSQSQSYMRLMDRFKKGADNKTNSKGQLKSPIAQQMDIGAFQYFQKKIKNRNSDNLLNDYKNISLALLYALLYKKNTVFVTADRDILAIVLTLAESLAQGMSFPYFFLPTLTSKDKRDLLAGKRITRFIAYDKFEKFYGDLLGDILNPYWKKNHFSFKVRLWDTKRQCFIEDLSINFNNMARQYILNMHGPLCCPFAKNNTHGNWIHCQYWPPPLKSPNVVKILLSRKRTINKRNMFAPDLVHQQYCKYAHDDMSGLLKNYLGFWL